MVCACVWGSPSRSGCSSARVAGKRSDRSWSRVGGGSRAGIPAGQPREGAVPGHHPALGIEHEDRILQASRAWSAGAGCGPRAAACAFSSREPPRTIRYMPTIRQTKAPPSTSSPATSACSCSDRNIASRLDSIRRLALDEGVGDLADVVGRGPPGVVRQHRVAPVELIGDDGGVELAELLRGGRAELGDLAQRLAIVADRRLELAHDRIEAQPRALVGLEIGDVAGQQVGALADLGVLQHDQRLAHQRDRLVVVDHQALLLGGRVIVHVPSASRRSQPAPQSSVRQPGRSNERCAS